MFIYICKSREQVAGPVSLAAQSHWLIRCQQILRDGAIRDRRFLSFVLDALDRSPVCVLTDQ